VTYCPELSSVDNGAVTVLINCGRSDFLQLLEEELFGSGAIADKPTVDLYVIEAT